MGKCKLLGRLRFITFVCRHMVLALWRPQELPGSFWATADLLQLEERLRSITYADST